MSEQETVVSGQVPGGELQTATTVVVVVGGNILDDEHERKSRMLNLIENVPKKS